MMQHMFLVSRQKVEIYFLTVIFALLAFFVAVFQSFGESPDYSQYTMLFDYLRNEDGSIPIAKFEPFFLALARLFNQYIGVDNIEYGCFVLIAISVKVLVFYHNAIPQKNDFPFMRLIGNHFQQSHLFAACRYMPLSRFWAILALLTGLVLYFFRFFPLHELTQIRAGLAASFLLLAAYMVWENHVGWAVLFSTVAITFHYSSLFIVPFLFFRVVDRKAVIWGSILFMLIVLALKFYLLNVFSEYFIPLQMALMTGFGDKSLNLFSPSLLLDWGIILFALWGWRYLTNEMKTVVFLELIGMSLFYATTDMQLIASRGRELFSIFWIAFIIQGIAHCNSIIRLGCLVFSLLSFVLYGIVFFGGNFFSG